jgi:hypothetical protein
LPWSDWNSSGICCAPTTVGFLPNLAATSPAVFLWPKGSDSSCALASAKDSHGLRDVSGARPARRGEVELDRLAAGARTPLDGDLSGTGLEDQRRGLLGAVDADPARSIPQPVQLQLDL